MFLGLRNIGMIENADIEINGVAVIAGENNSGKSTISKALFSVFNSFYQPDKQIASDRFDAIKRIISFACYGVNGKTIQRFIADKAISEIIKNKDRYINDAPLLRSDIAKMLVQNDEYFKKYIENIDIEGVCKKIIQRLNISDDDIFADIVQKKMQSEFSDQIVNANSPDKNGEIILRIKNSEVKIALSSNENTTAVLSGMLYLNTEAVYIDDPFVIDGIRPISSSRVKYAKHGQHLASKFTRETYNSAEGFRAPGGSVERIIISKKLEYVFEELNAVCPGEFVRKTRSDVYRESKSGDAFDITNVSTGLKTFIIIKTLLLNETIQENGIIILDEPESHLHPEWQLKFAKVIVLLQKTFNLHILINTHSPYFLNALEVHSYNFGTSSRNKYYLTENINKLTVFSDVTDNIEKVYEKLARPLQDLENLRYLND